MGAHVILGGIARSGQMSSTGALNVRGARRIIATGKTRENRGAVGSGGAGRRVVAIAAVVSALGLASPGGVPAGAAAAADADYGHPRPLALDVSGTNGAGRIDRPGRSCAEGGNGAHFHYEYGAPLAAGAFTSLPSSLRLQLDLHAEASGTPQPSYARAFMLGEASSVAISNERGTIRLALKSGEGTCSAANLSFDGTRLTAPATGTWRVVEATGSYREARAGPGPNTFELSAEVAPGADNPFRLRLNGSIQVLKPVPRVTVKKTYWGFLGVDYALRRVTVVYEVKNIGKGDAYGARLTDVVSTTAGTTPLGPKVQKLGDLAGASDPAKGEAEDARVKYQFALNQPCLAVILSCQFTSQLTVVLPDALDQPIEFKSGDLKATAPALPPPVL